MTLAPVRVFAGSYAAPDQPGIYALHFAAATGSLTVRASLAGIHNPSFILPHPNGRRLYAVSETSVADEGVGGSVWAVDCSAAPDQLTRINGQPSGGDWPCHLALDPSGRWLVVANYSSGSVSVLPLLADGALGPLTDCRQHSGQGVQPVRQAGPHAHSATFAPDGRFVLVADLGLDSVISYAFDATEGRLAEHTRCTGRPGAGPRHLTFDPTGQRVYVANELDNTVAGYDYDAATGALHERQVIETLLTPLPTNTVADIHITPSGERLYVSNRGDDSIAVFAVAASGELTRLAVRACGGAGPRNFALAPGAPFLLVANQTTAQVVVLPIGDDGEALGAPVSHLPIAGVACLQFATG